MIWGDIFSHSSYPNLQESKNRNATRERMSLHFITWNTYQNAWKFIHHHYLETYPLLQFDFFDFE